MDLKHLQGLMEAYQQVNAPQEEVQEGIKKIYHKIAAKHHERQADKAFEKGDSDKFQRHTSRSMVHRLDAGEKIKQVKNPEKFREYEKKLRTKKEEFEIDEAVKGADPEMRKAASAERRSGDKQHLSPSKAKANADKMERDVKYMDKKTKNNKIIVGMAHEEVDIFDATISELMEQGYTRKEALKIMANPTV